jgi:hypothetical protein
MALEATGCSTLWHRAAVCLSHAMQRQYSVCVAEQCVAAQCTPQGHAMLIPFLCCSAMQGSDFLLAPRYGEVLNVAALAMVFAATMPLMLLVMAPIMALAFFSQLAELLHVSRRPPAAVRSPCNAVLRSKTPLCLNPRSIATLKRVSKERKRRAEPEE